MSHQKLTSRAQLERQMDAARQLRSETVAGGTWVVSPLAAVLRLLRLVLVRIGSSVLRRA